MVYSITTEMENAVKKEDVHRSLRQVNFDVQARTKKSPDILDTGSQLPGIKYPRDSSDVIDLKKF